jgi:MFS family permease
MLILTIGFIGSLGFSALQSTFALFADHVVFPDADPSRVQLYIGLLLTLNGIIQVFTQLALLRRLVNRFGERKTLLVGQISLMVAMFGLGLIDRPLSLAFLLVPFAFGMGVSEPNLQALTTRFGADRTRGRLLGLYQSSRSMALIVGPVWAGFAFEAISPQAVFLVSGGLFVLNLGFALRLLGRDVPGVGGRIKIEE